MAVAVALFLADDLSIESINLMASNALMMDPPSLGAPGLTIEGMVASSSVLASKKMKMRVDNEKFFS